MTNGLRPFVKKAIKPESFVVNEEDTSTDPDQSGTIRPAPYYCPARTYSGRGGAAPSVPDRSRPIRADPRRPGPIQRRSAPPGTDPALQALLWPGAPLRAALLVSRPPGAARPGLRRSGRPCGALPGAPWSPRRCAARCGRPRRARTPGTRPPRWGEGMRPWSATSVSTGCPFAVHDGVFTNCNFAHRASAPTLLSPPYSSSVAQGAQPEHGQ